MRWDDIMWCIMEIMAVIWQCQHGLNSPMLNMLDVAVLGLAACLCRKPQNWYERQVRGFCVQNPYQWLVTASSLDCHCYKSGSPNKTHPLLVELLPFVPGLPTHTHTPHSSAGSCHKMASPLLYVKHGLVVANTCLGYGSGMHRVWHGVWNEKHDFSWLSKSLIINSSTIEQGDADRIT